MKKTIVFLGDSITDSGRTAVKYEDLGSGYPLLAASALEAENPGEYTFYNRGISGNRTPDLYSRFRYDGLNLKPDVISILIGINDLWHGIAHNNWATVKQYEQLLSMMIEETKEELPDCKIIIMEPFVLEGVNTKDTETVPNRWEQFKNGTAERRIIAKKVAEKYSVAFIPLQDLISKEAERFGRNNLVLDDGVHPTIYGNVLIAKEWLKCYKTL